MLAVLCSGARDQHVVAVLAQLSFVCCAGGPAYTSMESVVSTIHRKKVARAFRVTPCRRQMKVASHPLWLFQPPHHMGHRGSRFGSSSCRNPSPQKPSTILFHYSSLTHSFPPSTVHSKDVAFLRTDAPHTLFAASQQCGRCSGPCLFARSDDDASGGRQAAAPTAAAAAVPAAAASGNDFPAQCRAVLDLPFASGPLEGPQLQAFVDQKARGRYRAGEEGEEGGREGW